MIAVTFRDTLDMCAANPEFVAQFDRLTGHNLSEIGKRAPLDAMIDEATGRDRMALLAFVIFVDEVVWSRLPFNRRGSE